MVQWPAVIVLMMFAGIGGYFLHVGVVRRANRINAFDAYSDKELANLRTKTSRTARWRVEKHLYNARPALAYLNQIDREIKRRKRQAAISERGSIEEFDLVYEEVLRDISTREKN